MREFGLNGSEGLLGSTPCTKSCQKVALEVDFCKFDIHQEAFLPALFK